MVSPPCYNVQAKPYASHPPHPLGREIYRHDNLSLWEVDGNLEKVDSFSSHVICAAVLSKFVPLVEVIFGPQDLAR
jgi:hypothetical protein